MGYTYAKIYSLTKIEVNWTSSILSGNTNIASCPLHFKSNFFCKTKQLQPSSPQIFSGHPGSAYIWHSNQLSGTPSVCKNIQKGQKEECAYPLDVLVAVFSELKSQTQIQKATKGNSSRALGGNQISPLFQLNYISITFTPLRYKVCEF